ncbi:MAG TPA: prolyl oligopeptidase family serine peptidase [Candidatus Elarobacter sp.]|jgi:prolyl oligopeptidase|nr:prolyl oligopeptidase family serine peptidase [Candidatus Elarobacter sp.]
MRRFVFVVAAAVIGVSPALPALAKLAYPSAPRGTVTDNYFGTVVADPYRWMEDVDSPETTAWVKAEGALTRSYLDAIPQRDAIRTGYRKLLDYEKVSAPFHQGPWWFFSRNSGLQNQNVLYVRQGENGTPRVLLDPNTLAADGTVALAGTSFTHDGKLMAYSTQSSGADWQTWHVKDVATGNDLPDVLQWSKFSGASWAGDTGFYYEAYDQPQSGNTTLSALGAQKMYFHRLGTPQSADRLVYTAAADQFIGVGRTEDQRYDFFYRSKGDGNALAWKRASEPDSAFREIFALDPNVQYSPVGDDGTRIYIQTNANAQRGRIAWLDLTDPHHALHDIVPQSADTIDGVSLLGNRFYVAYLHDAHSVVRIYGLDGRALGQIALPGIGSGGLPGGHRTDRVVYYAFTSYTYPTTIYRFDTITGASTVAIRPKIDFDPSPYVTEQIFTTSKDGTRIPVFVVHRKNLPMDGSTPTILYGYGGFDISITPSFSSSIAMWLQMGGTYAVATLRGGGEYGDAWHDAGRLANKQHVFDDFIAAAQMLIDKKFTSTPKLAANGGSNGGLLVGAAITQRPDLWGAAIPEVGVMDMLRFQKFTVGKAWVTDYGSSEASADQFRTLYAYSPYQNIKDGTVYPPTLVMTSDHDDRVFPAHSFKFTAEMQHAQAGDAPILLRVESKAGHGAGRPTDKIIDDVADRYAFLVKNLNFNPTL